MTIAIIAIACFLSASIGACFGFMICAACIAAKKTDAIDDNAAKRMEDAA